MPPHPSPSSPTTEAATKDPGRPTAPTVSAHISRSARTSRNAVSGTETRVTVRPTTTCDAPAATAARGVPGRACSPRDWPASVTPGVMTISMPGPHTPRSGLASCGEAITPWPGPSPAGPAAAPVPRSRLSRWRRCRRDRELVMLVTTVRAGTRRCGKSRATEFGIPKSFRSRKTSLSLATSCSIRSGPAAVSNSIPPCGNDTPPLPLPLPLPLAWRPRFVGSASQPPALGSESPRRARMFRAPDRGAARRPRWAPRGWAHGARTAPASGTPSGSTRTRRGKRG